MKTNNLRTFYIPRDELLLVLVIVYAAVRLCNGPPSLSCEALYIGVLYITMYSVCEEFVLFIGGETGLHVMKPEIYKCKQIYFSKIMMELFLQCILDL